MTAILVAVAVLVALTFIAAVTALLSAIAEELRRLATETAAQAVALDRIARRLR